MKLPRRTVASAAAVFGVLLAVVLAAVPAGAFHLGYQTTTRVSVSSSGEEGNGGSGYTALSDDGRFVAFCSGASNLVGGDTNGSGDIFVRDLASGETTRASVSSSSEEGNGSSSMLAISADGRYIAFNSWASNLVPDDANGACDVFVRDLVSGETTLVSVSSNGEQGSGNNGGLLNWWGMEWAPGISADGRYVAFWSDASNLVSGGTGGNNIFVRDLVSGETTRASASSGGEQPNNDSFWPAISSDGRFVAFESYASNLVLDDTNGVADVFVRNLASGEITRATVSSTGEEGNANCPWALPALSADGRFVAFRSDASNLVPDDTNGVADVFVRDIQSGETTRVSVSSEGAQGDSDSYRPAMSSDGRYVAFHSEATNLIPDDTNGVADVFVRDLQSGETTRVIVSSEGAQGDLESTWPAISSDGRYVAFHSEATNLVLSDTNGTSDIFVRDRMRGSSLTVTSVSKTLTSHGASYTFAGRLESSGTPLPGRPVVLQASARSTGPWSDTSVLATTTSTGTFFLRDVPRSRTYYRASFAGEGIDFDASVSAVRWALPRAWVGTPIAPPVMYTRRTRTIYGYLKPRHTAGTYPVRIYRYRYVSRGWRSYGYVKARAYNYSTFTRYGRSLRLPYRGRWRLRAYHPSDSGQAAAWSAKYDYVTVR